MLMLEAGTGVEDMRRVLVVVLVLGMLPLPADGPTLAWDVAELRAAVLHRRATPDALRRRMVAVATPREVDAALREVHGRLLGWLLAGEARPEVRLRRLVARVAGDPAGFLRESGVLCVRARDVDDWVSDFLDMLWDDPIPMRVLDLHPRRRRALHRRAERAARRLLDDLRGRRFSSLAAKEACLRARLLLLRQRLLAEASR